MSTTYQVNGLDADGFTTVSREAFTLKEARREVAIIKGDPEYFDGVKRIQVINDRTGDCEIDIRVNDEVTRDEPDDDHAERAAERTDLDKQSSDQDLRDAGRGHLVRP